MADASLLEVHDLVVRYRARSVNWRSRAPSFAAVAGASISVGRGRTLAIVGESGCGKTTLARALVGLAPITSGSVRVGAHDVTRLGARPRAELPDRLGMVFQDPFSSLNPRMTAAELIAESWRAYPSLVHVDQRPAELERLIGQVGLRPEHLDRYPHQFSGGQRQRISIARALAARPSLLVLDEPVSALDVSIQAQILNLLAELQDELGVSYMFISHDLDVVRFIAHDVAVMYLGRIVEAGPADSVFDRPVHHYTRTLLAATPALGERHGSLQSVGIGDVPSPSDPPSGCHFHPRCPAATPLCASTVPSTALYGAGHLATCHHPLRDVVDARSP